MTRARGSSETFNRICLALDLVGRNLAAHFQVSGSEIEGLSSECSLLKVSFLPWNFSSRARLAVKPRSPRGKRGTGGGVEEEEWMLIQLRVPWPDKNLVSKRGRRTWRVNLKNPRDLIERKRLLEGKVLGEERKSLRSGWQEECGKNECMSSPSASLENGTQQSSGGDEDVKSRSDIPRDIPAKDEEHEKDNEAGIELLVVEIFPEEGEERAGVLNWEPQLRGPQALPKYTPTAQQCSRFSGQNAVGERKMWWLSPASVGERAHLAITEEGKWDRPYRLEAPELCLKVKEQYALRKRGLKGGLRTLPGFDNKEKT